METIAERLKSALERLRQTAIEANREPNSVQLLAVSKTKPVSDIVIAYEAGQRMFGENYVQEGVEKIQELQALSDIEWHFIGPLQSNKTRLVAEHFDWVESIDRLKIAKRLNDQRTAHKKLQVCIQVNIDNETSKAGVALADVESLAYSIKNLPNLELRGLMAIPAANQSVEAQTQSFSLMKDLFDKLQSNHAKIDTLSLGMSNDMEVAVHCGSTLVRIGTAIFGQRL
jgi:pyridoxal phosphate enzyme (YggS family)